MHKWKEISVWSMERQDSTFKVPSRRKSLVEFSQINMYILAPLLSSLLFWEETVENALH